MRNHPLKIRKRIHNKTHSRMSEHAAAFTERQQTRATQLRQHPRASQSIRLCTATCGAACHHIAEHLRAPPITRRCVVMLGDASRASASIAEHSVMHADVRRRSPTSFPSITALGDARRCSVTRRRASTSIVEHSTMYNRKPDRIRSELAPSSICESRSNSSTK